MIRWISKPMYGNEVQDFINVHSGFFIAESLKITWFEHSGHDLLVTFLLKESYSNIDEYNTFFYHTEAGEK